VISAGARVPVLRRLDDAAVRVLTVPMGRFVVYACLPEPLPGILAAAQEAGTADFSGYYRLGRWGVGSPDLALANARWRPWPWLPELDPLVFMAHAHRDQTCLPVAGRTWSVTDPVLAPWLRQLPGRRALENPVVVLGCSEKPARQVLADGTGRRVWWTQGVASLATMTGGPAGGAARGGVFFGLHATADGRGGRFWSADPHGPAGDLVRWAYRRRFAASAWQWLVERSAGPVSVAPAGLVPQVIGGRHWWGLSYFDGRDQASRFAALTSPTLGPAYVAWTPNDAYQPGTAQTGQAAAAAGTAGQPFHSKDLGGLPVNLNGAVVVVGYFAGGRFAVYDSRRDVSYWVTPAAFGQLLRGHLATAAASRPPAEPAPSRVALLTDFSAVTEQAHAQVQQALGALELITVNAPATLFRDQATGPAGPQARIALLPATSSATEPQWTSTTRPAIPTTQFPGAPEPLPDQHAKRPRGTYNAPGQPAHAMPPSGPTNQHSPHGTGKPPRFRTHDAQAPTNDQPATPHPADPKPPTPVWPGNHVARDQGTGTGGEHSPPPRPLASDPGYEEHVADLAAQVRRWAAGEGDYPSIVPYRPASAGSRDSAIHPGITLPDLTPAQQEALSRMLVFLDAANPYRRAPADDLLVDTLEDGLTSNRVSLAGALKEHLTHEPASAEGFVRSMLENCAAAANAVTIALEEGKPWHAPAAGRADAGEVGTLHTAPGADPVPIIPAATYHDALTAFLEPARASVADGTSGNRPGQEPPPPQAQLLVATSTNPDKPGHVYHLAFLEGLLLVTHPAAGTVEGLVIPDATGAIPASGQLRHELPGLPEPTYLGLRFTHPRPDTGPDTRSVTSPGNSHLRPRTVGMDNPPGYPWPAASSGTAVPARLADVAAHADVTGNSICLPDAAEQELQANPWVITTNPDLAGALILLAHHQPPSRYAVPAPWRAAGTDLTSHDLAILFAALGFGSAAGPVAVLSRDPIKPAQAQHHADLLQRVTITHTGTMSMVNYQLVLDEPVPGQGESSDHHHHHPPEWMVSFPNRLGLAPIPQHRFGGTQHSLRSAIHHARSTARTAQPQPPGPDADPGYELMVTSANGGWIVRINNPNDQLPALPLVPEPGQLIFQANRPPKPQPFAIGRGHVWDVAMLLAPWVRNATSILLAADSHDGTALEAALLSCYTGLPVDGPNQLLFHEWGRLTTGRLSLVRTLFGVLQRHAHPASGAFCRMWPARPGWPARDFEDLGSAYPPGHLLLPGVPGDTVLVYPPAALGIPTEPGQPIPGPDADASFDDVPDEWDESEPVAAGRSFYGQPADPEDQELLLHDRFAVVPDGVYLASIHGAGNSDDTYTFFGIRILSSPHHLARAIAADPGWTGDPVLLNSCNLFPQTDPPTPDCLPNAFLLAHYLTAIARDRGYHLPAVITLTGRNGRQHQVPGNGIVVIASTGDTITTRHGDIHTVTGAVAPHTSGGTIEVLLRERGDQFVACGGALNADGTFPAPVPLGPSFASGRRWRNPDLPPGTPLTTEDARFGRPDWPPQPDEPFSREHQPAIIAGAWLALAGTWDDDNSHPPLETLPDELEGIRPLATALYAYLGRGRHPGPELWEDTARGDQHDPQTTRARAVITAAHAFTSLLGHPPHEMYHQLGDFRASTADEALTRTQQHISDRILLPAHRQPDRTQPVGSIFVRIPRHRAYNWPGLTYQGPRQTRQAYPIAIARARQLHAQSATITADGHWLITTT
jgi:hypothetical protein